MIFSPGFARSCCGTRRESAVAKGVHDKLNTHPGGVPVENSLGEKWPLSGDGTLNAQTVARRLLQPPRRRRTGALPADDTNARIFHVPGPPIRALS